jgi:hypothetical protein
MKHTIKNILVVKNIVDTHFILDTIDARSYFYIVPDNRGKKIYFGNAVYVEDKDEWFVENPGSISIDAPIEMTYEALRKATSSKIDWSETNKSMWNDPKTYSQVSLQVATVAGWIGSKYKNFEKNPVEEFFSVVIGLLLFITVGWIITVLVKKAVKVATK